MGKKTPGPVARWALTIVGLALALLAPTAAQAVDVCSLYKEHAPRDFGLALNEAMSVTPEFCQAWSPDRKNTLLLRVMETSSASVYLAGVRQGAVNSGNGTIADESGLGAGAWSQRNDRSIEITFAAKNNLVMVVLVRDKGFSDADAVRARDFAKAVAETLR
jgi:hypothetical protein